jgi:hypothetical protein
MASPIRRAGQKAPSQAPGIRRIVLIEWYHPMVVFAIPLFAFLFGPVIYNLVAPHPIRPINEFQLQEVASLMDDIYTTLANMTFIPATAIKRGPHKINATAIPCKRNSAALQLMEIMPYVDRIELMDGEDMYRTDWLYGGEFIDYRRPDHLIDGCDPLRSENTWFSMTPNMVALTSWGTGGWNGDRTHVLLYDTTLNAIRVYDGEEWIQLNHEDDPSEDYYDYTGVGLFNHGTAAKLAALSIDNWEWRSWFDAPALLRRMLATYRSLAWTPWQTSNKEEGWGVSPNLTKELLRKNGWPETFDPDQFNADFIRATHIPSGRGPAEDVYNTIEELEGNSQEEGRYHDIGRIGITKQSIEQMERSIAKENDEQQLWYWVFRAQLDRWRLEQHEADLEIAKKEIERLCPDGVCVKKEDLILWEFYSLEKEYDMAQRASPPEKTCAGDLMDIIDWAPPNPQRYTNCVAKRQREAHWLHLAYTQCKAEALAHCAEAGCTLLPQPTLEDRARTKIKDMESQITRVKAKALVMYDWLPTLPVHAEKARTALERDMSAVANWPWNLEETIEWYKKQLADGGDKVLLERCLDDGSCVWGEH